MAEKTKKLEAELFQVRAQLERTSIFKLHEMLSIQKSALDRTGLGYGLSSFNTAYTSTTIFVPPASNTEIENNDVKIDLANENLDKGKSILGVPLKLDKKDIKNPKARRLTFKSLNRRSSISVIIMELPIILVQIAISG